MSGSFEPDDSPRAPAQRPGTIILVRHGKPDLARGGRFNAAGWDDWWARYGAAGLVPGQMPPADLLDAARDATHRLASPLRRAVETAELVFEGRPFLVDPLFQEAPQPAPPLPGGLILSHDQWYVLSRLGWVLGFSGTGESHTLARKRAAAAADRLEEAAADGNVVLCAHGWFNRMIRGHLVRRGWRTAYDGGDRFWSWRRLVKPA